MKSALFVMIVLMSFAAPPAPAQSTLAPITPDWFRVTKDDLYLVSWKLARLPWACATSNQTLNTIGYVSPKNCLAPKAKEIAQLIQDSTRQSALMLQTENELQNLVTRLESMPDESGISPKELRAQTREWQAKVASTIVMYNKRSQARPGEVTEKLQ